MKGFLRETYNYAILLVVLFAIASIAVMQTLSYLHDQLDPSEYRIVAFLIWILTLGFMLIAGAFGLFATQFSAQAESRRRVGRIVDTMDYIHDGLLAIDRKGRIAGSNPAARQMAHPFEPGHAVIKNAFPCLSDADAEQLIRANEPMELERLHTCGGVSCTLRFRSQPSEGMTLVLVSDITALNAQRRHNRQVARLQLVGQIGRGVAHDFNNILCVISGNASLLRRIVAGSRDAEPFVQAISHSVERGSAMATHLLELARSVTATDASVAEHGSLRTVVDVLRNSLPPGWSVEANLQKMDSISLSEVLLEQAILNVGLHTVESSSAPGVLHFHASPPAKTPAVLSVDDRYSGVLILSTSDIGQILQAGVQLQQRELSESGVILSVVRTLMEEAGGGMDCFTAPGGMLLYRILLPRATETAFVRRLPSGADLPMELISLVSGWKLLHARAPGRAAVLDPLIDRIGLPLKRVENISSVVSEISGTSVYHALLIDRPLLAKEGYGILRAVLRLMPSMGIVVLGEGSTALLGELAADVVAVHSPQDIRALLVAMIEARSLGMRRK